jgi:hypothetical protein
MNKIYNRKGYDFKEDLKDALVAVFWIAVIVFGVIAMLWSIDKIDQHEETATVVSIQRLDNAIVSVETEDNNLWEFETDLDDNIEIGDKVVVTFKEFENADRCDDVIVDYEVVE